MKRILMVTVGALCLNAGAVETQRFESYMAKWQATAGKAMTESKLPVSVLIRDTATEEVIELKSALASGEAIKCSLNGRGAATVWQGKGDDTPCLVRTSKGGGSLTTGKLAETHIRGDILLTRRSGGELQIVLGKHTMATNSPLMVPGQAVSGPYTMSTLVGY